MERDEKMNKEILLTSEVQITIKKLYMRIKDRFPKSNLLNICETLYNISTDIDKTLKWIEKPNYSFRVIVSIAIISILVLFLITICKLNIYVEEFNLLDLIQSIEALLNEIILIVLGIISIITIENRIKRAKVIKSISELTSISHVIDAHQLTKDPDANKVYYVPTLHSPERNMDGYETGRYLDYCAEMLSLTSKVGFLYVQSYHDHIAKKAFNDLESLTTGLASKIWQKISILKIEDLSK